MRRWEVILSRVSTAAGSWLGLAFLSMAARLSVASEGHKTQLHSIGADISEFKYKRQIIYLWSSLWTPGEESPGSPQRLEIQGVPVGLGDQVDQVGRAKQKHTMIQTSSDLWRGTPWGKVYQGSFALATLCWEVSYRPFDKINPSDQRVHPAGVRNLQHEKQRLTFGKKSPKILSLESLVVISSSETSHSDATLLYFCPKELGWMLTNPVKRIFFSAHEHFHKRGGEKWVCQSVGTTGPNYCSFKQHDNTFTLVRGETYEPVFAARLDQKRWKGKQAPGRS